MLNLIYDALRRTVYCMIAFLAFLVLMPSLPPYINEFHGMKEPQIIPFVEGLAPNHRLENAEPLSRGIQGSSSLGYLKVRAFLLFTFNPFNPHFIISSNIF